MTKACRVFCRIFKMVVDYNKHHCKQYTHLSNATLLLLTKTPTVYMLLVCFRPLATGLPHHFIVQKLTFVLGFKFF